jgi:hypothetical protein
LRSRRLGSLKWTSNRKERGRASRRKRRRIVTDEGEDKEENEMEKEEI